MASDARPPISIMPGMEQVVRAGDTLIITDKDNQQIAIKAVESEEVMTFLKAFDEYLTVCSTVPPGPIRDAAFTTARRRFNELPMPLQREMPSFKEIGLAVRGHSH